MGSRDVTSPEDAFMVNGKLLGNETLRKKRLRRIRADSST